MDSPLQNVDVPKQSKKGSKICNSSTSVTLKDFSSSGNSFNAINDDLQNRIVLLKGAASENLKIARIVNDTMKEQSERIAVLKQLVRIKDAEIAKLRVVANDERQKNVQKDFEFLCSINKQEKSKRNLQKEIEIMKAIRCAKDDTIKNLKKKVAEDMKRNAKDEMKITEMQKEIDALTSEAAKAIQERDEISKTIKEEKEKLQNALDEAQEVIENLRKKENNMNINLMREEKKNSEKVPKNVKFSFSYVDVNGDSLLEKVSAIRGEQSSLIKLKLSENFPLGV